MREGHDIESFLQNGYFVSSRGKAPEPRVSSSYSYDNTTSIPRYSHSTEYPAELRPRSFHPPPPTVEDEIESIAKEHGSVISIHPEEHAQNPGDPDQKHVIDDVEGQSADWDQDPAAADGDGLPERNSDWRFEYLGPASSSSDEPEEFRKARTRRAGEKYAPTTDKDSSQSNDCRDFIWVGEKAKSDGEKDKSDGEAKSQKDRPRPTPKEREDRDKRPIRERRKSKLEELPAIVTDLHRDGRGESRRDDISRSKSATGLKPGPDDYFSPRRSSQRLREESMLSPDVIKHSTKGRDRAYYDYSGPATPKDVRTRVDRPDEAREKQPSRRPDESIARPYSAGPVDPRKSSEAPRTVRRTSKEGSVGYDKESSKYDKPRQPSDRPTKTSRTNSYSASSRSERDSLKPQPSSTRAKRESPPYDNSRYSSEEDGDRRPEPRRRLKSFVRDERNVPVPSMVESKPPGRRSKPNTPLASPRVSQGDLFPEPYEGRSLRSSRSSTFPVNRDPVMPEPRYLVEDDSPRPLSRASTAKSLLSAAPIVIPVVGTTQDQPSPTDRRSAGLPAPQKARVVTEHRSESRSTLSTPSSSSPPKQAWQPPKFDPYKDGVRTEKKSASYRRYSEGLQSELPNLPDCPRTREQPGHVDWLTMPKCNNFNICPSCYESAFGNSAWRTFFVPAPFRPLERPLKCDFGTSMWYHIAWLLSHKYQSSNLRLLQGLNDVTAAHQPCSGTQLAIRIWYTIKDPVTQRPVRNFKVCHHCARSIETLLPNLSGVFVPMDSPAEPKSGICSMHQHGYGGTERKRFLVFWDMMETTSDSALALKRAPDIRSLADRVRELALTDECYGGRPVSGRKWHSMRSAPSFAACEECFNEVVWPEIERDDASGLAAEFSEKPQKLDVAACQLYSERMRRYFRDAVANDDVDYFRSKVVRRKQKEQEFYDKIRGLDPNVLGREWVDEEVDRAKREWRRYE